jgi:hypothetical protein
MTEFYQPASGLTFTEANLQAQTGWPPTTPVGVLAANGIYEIVPTPDPYDPGLYTSSPTYTIVGDYAEQGWTATDLPLPTAKENGSTEIKNQANAALDTILCDCDYNNDVVTAAASQVPASRPARYQAVLDEMTAITDQLDTNLTNIDAATSVAEINDIVNPPGGEIFTGRGSGLGPQDLNVSYYTTYNSVSLPESDTELYVPGTATVIPYGSGGAGKFDSMGNCFNPGDYLIQIRNAATGFVIAQFEVPLSPSGQNVAF